MNPIIKMENISYIYSNSTTKVLRDITLDIYEQQFITILGPNGSGKSTLVRLFNGLLLPTEGKVRVNNIDTRCSKEMLWRIRKDIGIVFQNPDNQIVGNTVEEDIAFSLGNFGIEAKEMRKRIDEILEKLGMRDLKNYDPNYLSGGQKQKVAIAGVIALKPKVIIFDEATSMLDPKGKTEVLNIMRMLNREENITIIQITHSIEEAQISDRIIIMNKGQVIKDDKAKNILNNRELLKRNKLCVPLSVEIGHQLKNRGYNVESTVRYEELIEEIWKLV